MTQEIVNNSSVSLEQQQLDNVKNILFESFFSHFTPLCEKVKKLPIAENLKAIILMKFDEGLLWVKEAFNTITVDTPMPPGANPAAKVVDVVDSNASQSEVTSQAA